MSSFMASIIHGPLQASSLAFSVLKSLLRGTTQAFQCYGSQISFVYFCLAQALTSTSGRVGYNQNSFSQPYILEVEKVKGRFSAVYVPELATAYQSTNTQLKRGSQAQPQLVFLSCSLWFEFILRLIDFSIKQAGAELCQAQFKFRLEVLLKP